MSSTDLIVVWMFIFALSANQAGMSIRSGQPAGAAAVAWVGAGLILAHHVWAVL
ncbi:hypothetical protein [Amorphus sp. MBR-141]